MNAHLAVTSMLTTHNDTDTPRQSGQPSQEPVHVHLFFHVSLLAAHHCLHTVITIAKGVCCRSSLSNHTRVYLPAAFDLVLGEAVVTVFVVETTCGAGEVGVET